MLVAKRRTYVISVEGTKHLITPGYRLPAGATPTIAEDFEDPITDEQITALQSLVDQLGATDAAAVVGLAARVTALEENIGYPLAPH